MSKDPAGAGEIDLHQTLDDINSTMESFLETASVDRVYGSPIEVGTTIIIPTAENLVIMGFGAGAGYGRGDFDSDEEDSKPGEGTGEVEVVAVVVVDAPYPDR